MSLRCDCAFFLEKLEIIMCRLWRPECVARQQVSGRSNITDFEEVVRLDTEYIKKWSPGLDIMILFKTVAVVLGKVGSK